ncbi:hypothetical protein [Streptococcus pneumoniae]|uniref:hypothetical protein n=1 Tax=Streptococcus pneumoniae TaxID=1313 RepID=UPI0010249165|nr:hypothetical protein [Streptococcus pneumoniae]VFH54475.1 N-ethylammeline chlorohydrolase [Streptococcus pneumoniae]
MKIKEQTRKLAAGCSKHCFKVVDGTDEVSSKHCFEVVDRTDDRPEYQKRKDKICPFSSLAFFQPTTVDKEPFIQCGLFD